MAAEYKVQEKPPLSSGWSETEPVTLARNIGSQTINLVGLVASKGEQQVSGSAGSLNLDAAQRAHFELLERSGTLDYLRELPNEIVMYDKARQHVGTIPAIQIFPPDSNSQTKHAKSNGVALGSSWLDACDRAAQELIEREAILRSWHGSTLPQKCSLKMSEHMQGPLNLFASSELVEFTPTALSRTHVIGIFSFPKLTSDPFVYGFGAGQSPELALAKAEDEWLQRLGFLWGEEIPNEQPEVSATPYFHQEYYLYPDNQKFIKDWLAGECYRPENVKFSSKNLQIDFVDMTPKHLNTGLALVKAYSPQCQPLIFGQTKQIGSLHWPEPTVHPIA